ncbi:MAG: hypothetical protein PUD30_03295 [Muribaculaceae bacterium]|nr:hypothetical protein [Muribaculaceae bacterium]
MRRFTSILISIIFVAFVTTSAALAATPVVPATPTITLWSDWTEEESCQNILNQIPTVDTNGNKLDINNLHYMVWLKTGEVVNPYYFSKDHYSLSQYTSTNGLEELPYATSLLNDNIQYGGSSVVLYAEVPDAVGLQSVYYVDGYRCYSDICWYNTKTFSSSIEALTSHYTALKGFAYTVTPENSVTVNYDDFNNITITFNNFSRIDLFDQSAISVSQSYDEGSFQKLPIEVTHEDGSTSINISVLSKNFIGGDFSGYFALRIEANAIKGYDANGNFEHNSEVISASWAYDRKEQKNEVKYTTDPAEGDVNNLHVIKITFTNHAVASVYNYGEGASFTFNGEPRTVTIQNGSTDNILEAWVDVPNYSTGKCVLTIPAGTLYLFPTWVDGEPNSFENNESDIIMEWNVVSDVDFTYKASPSEGEVEQLSTIEISFINQLYFYFLDASAISLTHDNNPVEITADRISNFGCGIKVVCAETQTEPGEYVLTILPEACAGRRSDGEYFFHPDSSIVATWTIPKPISCWDYSVNPAEGNVGSINNIEITFPNISIIKPINSYAFQTSQCTLTHDGERLTISPSFYNDNIIKIGLPEPMTTPGTYVLTISAQSIYFNYEEDSSYIEWNPDDIVMTWTIDDSGSVSSIETGPATISDIYGINGVRRSRLEKGLNVVKMTDGSYRKIIIK